VEGGDLFESLGRVLALALYHGESLPLRLTPALCRQIMGQPFDLSDLLSVDPVLFDGQVRYLREHGTAGLDGLSFEVPSDDSGVSGAHAGRNAAAVFLWQCSY
jgi:hypothetical protein